MAQQLSLTLPQLEERLAELSLLLLAHVAKLDRLEAKLVLHLVSDLPATTQHILDLRHLLSCLDYNALLADSPWLLTQVSPEFVRRQLAELAQALPRSVDVERLVAAEPMLLRADIQAVLADLRRLMPGQDPWRCCYPTLQAASTCRCAGVVLLGSRVGSIRAVPCLAVPDCCLPGGSTAAGS